MYQVVQIHQPETCLSLFVHCIFRICFVHFDDAVVLNVHIQDFNMYMHKYSDLLEISCYLLVIDCGN